jgi:hypothetical protein
VLLGPGLVKPSTFTELEPEQSGRTLHIQHRFDKRIEEAHYNWVLLFWGRNPELINRFGNKLWALCGTSGYCLKFDLYRGKDPNNSETDDLLLGSKEVLTMLEFSKP